MNVHAIALWVGIIGTGAAVYFPMQTKIDAAHQDATKQAAARQKTLDEINDRFANLEMVVTVLSQETPKNTQMILRQIKESRRLSQERPIVMFDRSAEIQTDAAEPPQIEVPQ